MRLPCQQTLPAVMLSFSQFLIWDDLVWIFKRNDTQVSKRMDLISVALCNSVVDPSL